LFIINLFFELVEKLSIGSRLRFAPLKQYIPLFFERGTASREAPFTLFFELVEKFHIWSVLHKVEQYITTILSSTRH